MEIHLPSHVFFQIASVLRRSLNKEREDLHRSEARVATFNHPETISEVKQQYTWASVIVLTDRVLSFSSAVVVAIAIGVLFPRG